MNGTRKSAFRGPDPLRWTDCLIGSSCRLRRNLRDLPGRGEVAWISLAHANQVIDEFIQFFIVEPPGNTHV